MPQLDTQDRERDNHQRAGPENLPPAHRGLRPVGVIYPEMWWTCGSFGWWSGFLIPKPQMLEFTLITFIFPEHFGHVNGSTS